MPAASGMVGLFCYSNSMSKQDTEVSKLLRHVLRHKPQAGGQRAIRMFRVRLL